jgi:hypothetical protein
MLATAEAVVVIGDGLNEEIYELMDRAKEKCIPIYL